MYFYCNFDKLITAILNRKKQFMDFISNLKLKDEYLIIGRNNSDLLTYPNTWVETETITNKAAAE